MDSSFYIALACLFAGFFGSRILSERALRLLSAEEKVTLLDAFSRMRTYGNLPLWLLAALFIGSGRLPSVWIPVVYYGTWALLALYFVATHIYVVRRMEHLNISRDFRRAHTKARCVSYAGFLAFFLISTFSHLR